MHITVHHQNGIQLAEITSPDLLIQTAEDGLDLLGNLYYQDFDRIILYQENISPEFFDLKTGLAGEILQKFTTYRVRLVIIGEFETFTSKSLQDFMRESNQRKQVNFVPTLSEAIQRLAA